MAHPLAHVFLGHAVPPVRTEQEGKMERRASVTKRACTASQMYTYPSAGTTFNAGADTPITFKWDTSCLTAKMVDLELHAPKLNPPVIKNFSSVPFADGEYKVTLLPKWWNSTTTVDLQLQITDASAAGLGFLTSVPGPVFTVTYPRAELVTTTVGGSTVAAAAADTGSPDPITTTVTKQASDGLPAGSIFAAVFFPVAIVAGAVALYIVYTRKKQAKKRQRWSQAVDNRMSVISSHWDRTSSHHTGTPRRSMGAVSQNRRTVHSTFSAAGAGENFAGFGAHRSDDYPQGGPGGTEMFEHNQGQQQHPEMVEVIDADVDGGFARSRTQYMDKADRSSKAVSFASDGAHTSRVSFGDVLSAGGNPAKVNSVYSQGHQRSKSSLSGAMGAALRQRPSIYTNGSPSTTSLSRFAGAHEGERKESIDMVLSPERSTGPWVLGENEVDRYGTEQGGHEERLVDSEAAEGEGGSRLSQSAAGQLLDTPVNGASGDRASFVSRPSSYGSHISTAHPAPTSPDLSSPSSPMISPPVKAATVASFFPPPVGGAGASPDDAFQAYARERSGSVATPGDGEVDVRGSVVGENNPFRSSMFDSASPDQ